MAQAIAAAVSLALAVKLKKIMEQEDRFLSFPRGLGFSYDYLEFMHDPARTSLSAQEQLNFRADFARLMNLVPEDSPNFIPDGSRFLWEDLRQVLVDSVFARSTLTEEEERRLAAAIDFLTDERVDDDGFSIPVNSAAVNRYYEYKTLHEEATRNYLDEKLSVDFAEGPDAQRLREQWQAYRQKQLLEACQKAERDWVTLGFKHQVEECMALQNSLELRKYLNRYRQAYLSDLELSEIVDLSGQGVGFFTTFFSPLNVFDRQVPWTRITLTRAEMEGLIREAPPELAALFGSQRGDPGLEAVSLEYNNVMVLRPWFKPEFFGSRCWKLPDGRTLSDGRVPGRGILPAYVNSMIVARNVQVVRRRESLRDTLVLPLLSKVPLQQVKFAGLPVARVQPVVPGRLPVGPATLSRSATLKNTLMRAALARPEAAMAEPAPPSFSRVAPLTARKRAVTAERDPGLSATATAQQQYAAAKLEGLAIRSPLLRRGRLPVLLDADARLTPAGKDLVTEAVSLDGVSVLALVCKRLPKSPDPDDGLQW